MEGYLEKKGGFLGSAWQERFFRLNNENQTLDYFDNGLQRGRIEMRGASIQPHPDGVFAICGDHLKHTYVLRLKDPTRRAQWLHALNASTSEAACQAERCPESSSESSPSSLEKRPKKVPPPLKKVAPPPAPLPLLPREAGWVQIAAVSRRRRRSLSPGSTKSPHAARRSPAECSGPCSPDGFPDSDGPAELSHSFAHSDTAIAPSPATCCPPGFCHAGKVWKRRGVLGTWNERWCSFDVFARTLSYYTSEHGSLKGEFDVEGASVEPWEDGVTFTIRAHRWEHTLQFPSSASRAVWLAALRPLVQVGPAHCTAVNLQPSASTSPNMEGGIDAHFERCQSCSTKFNPTLRARSCLRCQRPFCGKCCVWRHHLPHLPHGENCRVCAGCHQLLSILEAEAWERQLLAVQQADDWDDLCHLRRWREECLVVSPSDPLPT